MKSECCRENLQTHTCSMKSDGRMKAVQHREQFH